MKIAAVITTLCTLLLATSCRSPESFTPQLAPTPPVSETGKRRKLMIIGIDGTRPDAIMAASAQTPGTPNLDLLSSQAASFNTLTGDISFSGPGWSSMLTGVWCDKHEVLENEFATKNFADYPHFFVRLKAAFPGAITASVSHWDKINLEIVGAHPNSSDHTITSPTDAAVATEVANLLTSTEVDAIFMQFDDVDHQGHDCCFDPTNQAYLDTIKTTDGHVGTVLAALNSRPNIANEEWLILVSSDHGGGGGPGPGFDNQHGPDTEEDRTMFLFAYGPTADPAKMPSGAQRAHITDVAVTALTHLQVPIDPAWGLEGQAVGIDEAAPYATPVVPMCSVGFGSTDPGLI